MINDSKEKITDFLFINKDFNDLDKYDLVIVLGNDLYQENALTIKKLYENNNINSSTLIIISGNKGRINKDISKTEALLIYEYLSKYNFTLNIILEEKATNIKENLLNSINMVKNINNYKKILLIGKSFASRRILMCADKIGFPLKNIDIYGIEGNISKHNWWKNKEATNRVLEELERISKYVKTNDLLL